VPIEVPEKRGGDNAIVTQATALREAGKLINVARVKALLDAPVPEAVTLPPARTTPLAPPDIYELARVSHVQVGWHYLCQKCKHWHSDLSGGYAITEDGVIVTCHHVAVPEDKMREGYLIVVDAGGKVWPVTSLLAASAARDVCLLRAGPGPFRALPLNDAVRPGDAAFCLSDPLELTGYFSDGIVNRFYRKPGGTGTPDENLRLHVSTDWAPGSSGSPVLDRCGNVIGHVSTIQGKSLPTRKPAETKTPAAPSPTILVVHEASPARSVIHLIEAARKAAASK
jgi:hypothetical protein